MTYIIKFTKLSPFQRYIHYKRCLCFGGVEKGNVVKQNQMAGNDKI